MSYEFQVDPNALFNERTPQFANLGIPMDVIRRVRAAVTTMWANEPGGWTYEWSTVADEYAERGEHYLASLAYGAAKFPVLANSARREAFGKQIKEYLAADSTFGVHLERRVLDVPYRGATTKVAVHLLSFDGTYNRGPVLLFSGGIDTWKMDLHPLAVAFVRGAGVTVMAFDLPGTGESQVPLDAYADEVIRGLVAEGRRIGAGSVGHFGLSFGGNFSAMSGLSALVEAAIDLGGPVKASFEPEHAQQLLYGMRDIAGNAFGFSASPTDAQLLRAAAVLSRRTLLDQVGNAAMLVVNGADDVHVPQSDTLVFEGRSNTEVHLVPGTGHVAASKLLEIMPLMIEWLRAHLASDTPTEGSAPVTRDPLGARAPG